MRCWVGLGVVWSLPLALSFQQVTLHTGARHRCSMSSSRRSDIQYVTKPAAALHAQSPKLIVFDLDNTLWTPELYQLRKLQRAGKTPVAGRDVKLFKGAQQVFEEIRNGDFPGTKIAVASRTQNVDWAHDLLKQFEIDHLVDYVEIFPANKKTHFENIRKESGIEFKDMLFFDDARDGRYGNCKPVSEMGVLSVHCAGGIDSYQVFDTGMKRYAEWDQKPGTIIEWDGTVSKGSVSPKGRQQGTVKMFNDEKGFGFLQYGDRATKDVFFHSSNLPSGCNVEKGDELSFVVKKNAKNGKFFASDIQAVGGDGNEDQDMIEMRVFSMNLPFAALLANGYKDLETRNGTMFVPYPEGTQMLLHVGQRIYPDGNRHLEVMKSGGLGDEEIAKLKSLPKGFSKGAAVAILELGKTYETTVEERSDPDIQRRVAAFGTDSGRMVTEIKKVAYLKRPVKLSGSGGVFKSKIPESVLPDDWLLAPEIKMTQNADASEEPQLVYEISG